MACYLTGKKLFQYGFSPLTFVGHNYMFHIIVTFVTVDLAVSYSHSLLAIVVNPLSTKLYLSNLKIQLVPRIKHSASVIKTDKLMLYREIIAVCSEIHAKHINVFWAEHRISEC